MTLVYTKFCGFQIWKLFPHSLSQYKSFFRSTRGDESSILSWFPSHKKFGDWFCSPHIVTAIDMPKVNNLGSMKIYFYWFSQSQWEGWLTNWRVQKLLPNNFSQNNEFRNLTCIMFKCTWTIQNPQHQVRAPVEICFPKIMNFLF